MDAYKIVKAVRDYFDSERKLYYSDGYYGITSLLQCKLKVEYSKQFKKESVEIDAGYIFEHAIKMALKKAYGDKAKEEYTFKIKHKDMQLQPHIDIVIKDGQQASSIELKAIKQLKANGLPQSDILTNKEVEEYGIELPEKYVKQTMFQKALLEAHLKTPVKSALFILAHLISEKGSKRVFIYYEVESNLTLEDIYAHYCKWLTRFPLEPQECYYCPHQAICKNHENDEDHIG